MGEVKKCREIAVEGHGEGVKKCREIAVEGRGGRGKEV